MYIFGYGSLINSASRQLTEQTGEEIPVVARRVVTFKPGLKLKTKIEAIGK